MSSSEDPWGDSNSPHSHREIHPQTHYPNRHTLWPHTGALSLSLSLSLSFSVQTHQITMLYKFSPHIALFDGKEFETSSSIPRSRIRWSPNWSKKNLSFYHHNSLIPHPFFAVRITNLTLNMFYFITIMVVWCTRVSMTTSRHSSSILWYVEEKFRLWNVHTTLVSVFVSLSHSLSLALSLIRSVWQSLQ